MSEENGILALVPGQFVAQALNALPEAARDTEPCRQAVIDVPGLGRVRFTCRRVVSRKGRAKTAFWAAQKAEQVADDGTLPEG